MSAAQAVQAVEIEAALARVARGEGDHNDANLLRSIFQQLTNEIRQLQAALDTQKPAG